MLDEQLWLKLNDVDKIDEIQECLNKLLAIENGEHELCGTRMQGKLVTIKKDLQDKIFKIIEIENAT